MDILGEEEDYSIDTQDNDIFHDYREIFQNYEELKKSYKSKPILSKYEKTKIIGLRAQQIATGAKPLIDVPQYMSNTIEIAELELKQRKTPFIIKRKIGKEFEYWKIEDLSFTI